MQKEEKGLRDRMKAFAIRVVRMFSTLPKTTEAQVLGKQLLRSGTSIGANYREAFRERSKAEWSDWGEATWTVKPRGSGERVRRRANQFFAKCGESLREIEESAYWLELHVVSGVVKVERFAPFNKSAKS